MRFLSFLASLPPLLSFLHFKCCILWEQVADSGSQFFFSFRIDEVRGRRDGRGSARLKVRNSSTEFQLVSRFGCVYLGLGSNFRPRTHSLSRKWVGKSSCALCAACQIRTMERVEQGRKEMIFPPRPTAKLQRQHFRLAELDRIEWGLRSSITLVW